MMRVLQNRPRFVLGLLVIAGVLTTLGSRLSPPRAVAADGVFDAQVQPVLTKHCASCHAGAKLKGGLDLASVASILKGGHSGPVLVPGKAAESLLVQVVDPKGEPHMPPKGQLTPAEIAVLKKWVDGMQPATKPTGRIITAEDRQHWAYRKLERASLPKPRDVQWIKSPVDAFVLARLEAAGLKPSPPAEKRELIRRVAFDLLGLPPTPDEVEAFVADPAPDAYERLIDRLLASPHYGERWGRHWLDLARYAESNGIGEDRDRPHAWRYRDYVIQSFNEDKPYGQFVREQLAGDETDPDNPEALVATGFCRLGPTVDVIRGQDAEKYRLEEMDDVVTTASAVFLGLTLGCARCHDHKIDPVTQADYYRFLAIFNSTTKKDVPLEPQPVADKKTPYKGPAMLVVTDIGPAPRKTNLLWRGDVRTPGPEVQPGVPEVLTAQPLNFAKLAAGAKTTGRRTVLADWLASPDNGLAWRVIVNRVWQYHFGRALVDSSNNFGLNGDKPTHPELLDWLALQFIEQGGKFKALHKLILLSNTYRQSSAFNPAAAKADPENLLLWRVSKKRLEAEPIRDAVLHVSGKLNPEFGGPSIRPKIHPNLIANAMSRWPAVAKEGPEHWRRSIYIHVKRSLQMPMMELFDAPTPTASCNRRAESTVPTQALLLMNGEFMNDQAAHFAERVRREAGDDPARQIERAFWLALSRQPTKDEIQQVAGFLRQQADQPGVKRTPAEAVRAALTDLCHVLLTCNEFVYVN
ncbi:MAG: PSD1 domain-containing protein [Planctomycetia bacterium]|nr:PSD1 domain-containing protein [Planctomycetia bacterium]